MGPRAGFRRAVRAPQRRGAPAVAAVGCSRAAARSGSPIPAVPPPAGFLERAGREFEIETQSAPMPCSRRAASIPCASDEHAASESRRAAPPPRGARATGPGQRLGRGERAGRRGGARLPGDRHRELGRSPPRTAFLTARRSRARRCWPRSAVSSRARSSLPVTADLERGFGDFASGDRRGCDRGRRRGLQPRGLDRYRRAVAGGGARRGRGGGARRGRGGRHLAGDQRPHRRLPRGHRRRRRGDRARPCLSGSRRGLHLRARRERRCQRCRRSPPVWAGRSACSAIPAGRRSPSWARIGVARVSYGPGPMGVAMAALARAAESLLAGGDPPADLAFRP